AAAPWCLVERAGAGTGARDLARELVAQVHAAVPATDIEPALTVNGVHRDWRAVLGRALVQCRLVALRFLAVDVAAVQDRCEDVTAGCYALWRGRGDVDRTEASTWVERAIDSIAASLLDQTLSRLAELHRAMPAAVTAATDADATPPGSGPVPAGALA